MQTKTNQKKTKLPFKFTIQDERVGAIVSTTIWATNSTDLEKRCGEEAAAFYEFCKASAPRRGSRV